VADVLALRQGSRGSSGSSWPRDRSPRAAVEHFLEVHCRAKGLSEQTIRDSYGSPLRRMLVPWCDGAGLVDAVDLTPDAVERFAAHLAGRRTGRGQPIRPATSRAYLKAVQQLVAWLQKEPGVTGLDSRRVPMPRLRRQERDVLTPAEVGRLEEAGRIERDKLIIRLMWETGAREGEVAGLQVADLIIRDGRYFFVRVRGKTGERTPPITAALYRRLKDYAAGKSGRPRVTSEFVFMAHRKRNQGGYEPLTEAGVYEAIREAAGRAQLGKRVYPHLLRHSCITRRVARGDHPALISADTGVSIAVIAQHYSHPTPEQRWEAAMKSL